MILTATVAAFSLSLALADQPAPPPPPPHIPVLVHGLIYFEPGGVQRVPVTGKYEPIAYLAPKVTADAYVYIRGHTDTVGDAKANHALSLRRARWVGDALVTRGVRPEQITLIACGEALRVVPTPDNTPEQLNRLATFDWGPRPPKAPEGCTSHSYARP